MPSQKLKERNRQEVCREILRLLGQKSRLSISKITKFIGVNRSTAAKYLQVLKAQGILDYEQKGQESSGQSVSPARDVNPSV